MAKTANGVQYERTESGSIRMVAPKTIGRYCELTDEHPKTEDYGVFFAYGQQQFEEGRRRLVRKGYLKNGEHLTSAGMGLYGTHEEIVRFNAFYKERGRKIAEECNPQEVYFYECNNHECGYTYCDDEVVQLIADYFGKEEAHKIVRVYGGSPTNVLAPLTERDEHLQQHQDTLMMLSRFASDCEGFFNEHDCRYHREGYIYNQNVKMFIDEMLQTYRKLPDDIKDESPLSREAIVNYQTWLEAWASEEYGKEKYDPVPRTKPEDLPKEIYLDEKLYYKDDNGMWQTPSHVWFSHDSRRWHQDGRRVHGRAMTSYLGKNGTTLAPVYILDIVRGSIPYRREDLCDVSCKYTYTPWIKGVGVGSRLFDFYYE